MRYYMIRQRTTGQWLPHPRQRNKTSACLTTSEPPRLFASHGSAQKALNWWCDGIAYMGYRPYDGAGEYDLRTDHRPERSREAMEIVEVLLIASKEKA